MPGVVWCGNALEAAEGAHVLAVVTEWNEFRALDLDDAKSRMAGNALVDLRNIFLPAAARSAGLAYSGIGRS